MYKSKTYIILFSLCLIFNLNITNGADLRKTALEIKILDHPSPGNLFIGDIEVSSSIFNNYAEIIDTSKISKLPPGVDFKIQPNGMISLYSNDAGIFYIFNKNLDVIDSFAVVEGYGNDSHEFVMPNDSTYFVFALQSMVIDMELVVEGGQKNVSILNSIIQKYNSEKKLVWSWSLYDNLPVTDMAKGLEGELLGDFIDPYHINSLDIDSSGNIIVSIRNFNEIIKIDPNTNKILWRLGGSKSKHNEFTFLNDVNFEFTGFSNTHDSKWLPNGNLLLIDNGNLRFPAFSRAVEYKIDQVNKTAEKVWEFVPEPNIFIPIFGSAQRLENGNTFMTFNNSIYEVDKNGKKVFEANKVGGGIYRGYKYIFGMSSSQKDITTYGTYDFNNNSNPVKAKVNIQSLETPGYMSISRHSSKPLRFNFNELLPSKIINQRWVVQGNAKFIGKVNLDLSTFTDIDKSDSLVAYIREDEDNGKFVKVNSIYNNELGTISIDISKNCEIIIGSNDDIENSTINVLSPKNNELVQNRVEFTWDPVASADTYELQISESDDFSNPMINIPNLTTISYYYPDFTNGKTYYFRIRAKVGNQDSKWTQIYQINVILNEPVMLSPLNESFGNRLNSKLVWTQVPNAENYDIQISKDINFTTFEIEKLSYKDTTLELQNLNYNTNYYWRINSGNKFCKSVWSQTQSFKTELNIPQITYPVNNSIGVESNFVLLFNKFSGITYYQLIVSRDSLFLNSQYYLLSAKQQAKINLAINTNYFVKLRAIADIDTSRWSEMVRFATSLPIPTLKYPLKNDVLFTNDITFEIENSTNAQKYEINVVSTNIDNNITIIDTTFEIPVNTLQTKFLDYKTKNIWRARIINQDVKSEWTNFNEFFIGLQGSLSAPTQYLPINNSQNIAINGNLIWKPTIDLANKYIVMLSENENFENIVKTETTTKNYCYFNNLNFNTKYYWRVSSTNNGEFGEWSPTWSFITKSPEIIAPPNLILPIDKDETIEPVNVQFIWENVANVVAYHFQLSKYNDFSNLDFEENNFPGYSYDMTSLEAYKTYYWRVQSKFKDSLNYGDWSEIFSFTTNDVTSLNESDVNSEKITNLSFENEYSLVNVVGQIIYLPQSEYKNIEDLKAVLSPGIFFVVPKLKSNNLKVSKIVVN